MVFEIFATLVALIVGVILAFIAVPNARLAMWLAGTSVMLLEHYQIQFELFPAWQAKIFVLGGAFAYCFVSPEFYASERGGCPRSFSILNALARCTMWLLVFVAGFSALAIAGGPNFDWIVFFLIEVISLMAFFVLPFHFVIASAMETRYPATHTARS